MTTIAKGKKEAQRLLLQTAPTKQPYSEEINFSVNYLSFFGYIAVSLLKNITRDDLENAVKKFQGWFGLEPDGIVGPRTVRAMEAPRCGCPDIDDEENPLHRKFMAMNRVADAKKAKWNKTGLTYAVKRYVAGPDTEHQLEVFDGAFKAWSDACGLTIDRIANVTEADMVINTGSGRQHNFDGRGGTLAWAYFPDGRDKQLQMKFDLDETWVINPKQRGVLLFNVACHEIGHMLGLKHSESKTALMAPYYNANIGVPQWDDDIMRVQGRYGRHGEDISVATKVTAADDTGKIYNLQCRKLIVDGYTLVPNE